MPSYTYHCDHCGHQFDKHQDFNEPALKACPVCRKRGLRKVYRPAGIVFKGSGFYVTDKRAKPAKASSSSNGRSKTSAETKAETKKDTRAPTVEKKAD